MAVTVPTTVPFGLFSARLNVAGDTTGASLRSVRLIVTVASPERTGTPVSVTRTVRLNVGLVSKSTAATLATVICPEVGWIANAPPVLPPMMLKAHVCPASGSANVIGVPTSVPFGLFSGMLKVAGLTTGASLAFVRLTVMVAVPD